MSSRTADLRIPLASYALETATTLIPGTPVKYRSMLWACCAPRPVAPTGARITIGTLIVPPDMYRNLAALLAIWSMAKKRKSPY